MRIIEINNCSECPHARAGVLSDICDQLENASLKRENQFRVRDDCPLKKVKNSYGL
jgi:hypothetical protein